MPRPSSRQEILRTAVQIASVRGLEGLSIGGLAAAVGKSKGGICAHFPSKGALQLAVVDEAAELFRREVVEPVFEVEPGLTRLEALVEAWFRYIEAGVFEGGCFFTNAAFELDDLEQPEVLAQVRKLYRRYLALLERCTAEAVERGELIDTTDPEALAFELHAMEAAALVRRALGEADAYTRAARHARTAIDRRRAPVAVSTP